MDFSQTKSMYDDWIFKLYKRRLLSQFVVRALKSEAQYKPVWEKEIAVLDSLNKLDEVEPLVSKFPHGNIIDEDKNCNLLQWTPASNDALHKARYSLHHYSPIKEREEYYRKFPSRRPNTASTNTVFGPSPASGNSPFGPSPASGNSSSGSSPASTRSFFDPIPYNGLLGTEESMIVPVLVTDRICSKIYVINSKFGYDTVISDFKTIESRVDYHTSSYFSRYGNPWTYGEYASDCQCAQELFLTGFQTFPLKWNTLCQIVYDKQISQDRKKEAEERERKIKAEKEKDELERKMKDFMNNF